MTIPDGVARISISGVQGTGEIFETGFWISAFAIENVGEAQTLVDQIAAIYNAGVRAPVASIAKSDTIYQRIKGYFYPTGGPTATYIAERIVTAATVGTGTGTNPLYTCMVLGLRTGLSGRTNRGRMYLPATGAPLDTAHRFASADAAFVCNNVATFFTNINAITSPAIPQVIVLSQKLGTFQTVTDVTADSKPDVQRRRENRMTPGTVATAVVTP